MLGSSHDEPGAADPALALMDQVGAALREARRERGKAIEDVAEILRIQPAYLAALERGDLSAIPGRTYALGFLRSYAQYLGFDGDDMIAQIKSSVGLAGGAALQGRAPLTESRLPKVPILVISLAVLVGAYAGWAYFEGGKAPVELVEEVPDDLRKDAQSLFDAGLEAAPPAPLPAEVPEAVPPAALPPEAADAIPAIAPNRPAATPPAPIDAAPDPAPHEEPQAALTPPPDPVLGGQVPPVVAVAAEADLAAGQGPAPLHQSALASGDDPSAGPGSVALHQVALAPEAQPPEVEPARGPRIYGTASPESRVVLRARERAWLHVSSRHNDYLWVQTLRPGDSFIVPARPDLLLWTGNAGGVEVLVDGALLPPLGPDAVVVRDVSLQPRALLRRLLPLPAESAGVSDLASAAKPPMMPPSSR